MCVVCVTLIRVVSEYHMVTPAHTGGPNEAISGTINRPPLHPIPVSKPFQIVGVDIMDLPLTKCGNCHVVVFQDF